MERLVERGEALAQVAARQLLERTAGVVRGIVPDAAVTIVDGGVAVEAWRLEARRDADPVLRWIGGAVR